MIYVLTNLNVKLFLKFLDVCSSFLVNSQPQPDGSSHCHLTLVHTFLLPLHFLVQLPLSSKVCSLPTLQQRFQHLELTSITWELTKVHISQPHLRALCILNQYSSQPRGSQFTGYTSRNIQSVITNCSSARIHPSIHSFIQPHTQVFLYSRAFTTRIEYDGIN